MATAKKKKSEWIPPWAHKMADGKVMPNSAMPGKKKAAKKVTRKKKGK